MLPKSTSAERIKVLVSCAALCARSNNSTPPIHHRCMTDFHSVVHWRCQSFGFPTLQLLLAPSRVPKSVDTAALNLRGQHGCIACYISSGAIVENWVSKFGSWLGSRGQPYAMAMSGIAAVRCKSVFKSSVWRSFLFLVASQMHLGQ